MKNAHGSFLRMAGPLFALVLLTAGCDFDFGPLFSDPDPNPPYRPPGADHIYILSPADSFDVHLNGRWAVSRDSCGSTFFTDTVLLANVRYDQYMEVHSISLWAECSGHTSALVSNVNLPSESPVDIPYVCPQIYQSGADPFLSDTVYYTIYAVLNCNRISFNSQLIHGRLIFHDPARLDSLPDAPRMSAVIQNPLDSALIVNWCDHSFDENYFLVYRLISDSLIPLPDTVQSVYWGYYLWNPLPNTRYSFFVAARNIYGTSPPSDTISIITR
ncbi:fibronectin type III domain-containing protein [candidate division KSB1 bacterium]|nr:MAG: fibronectin type III domain-containing protein [candidate division KSB1 bacterium]